MTFLSRLCFLAALGLATTVHAQAPANPDNTSAQAAQAQVTEPVAAASATPGSIEPPSLIPPNSLPLPGATGFPAIPVSPELEQLNAFFKQSSLGAEADEKRLHLQWAQLRVRLRNDEDLQRLKAFAFAAPTDLELRHRLRRYYNRYYEKLRALATAPDLQAYLKAEGAVHKLALLQPRVRHETDEAEVLKLATERVGVPGAVIAPLPTPPQAKVNDINRP